MRGKLLTEAEQVLMRGEKTREGEPLSLARARALSAFAAHGLPSRKQENWHYTDLRILLREVPEEILPSHHRLYAPLVAGWPVIGLVNGTALKQFPKSVQRFSDKNCDENKQLEQISDSIESHSALSQNLPDFVCPLQPRFDLGDEAALPKWREGDIIAQINAAHVSDGFKIDLAQESFLEIQNIVEGGQAHIHLPMTIAADTCTTIILREIGDAAASFSTTLSNLEIGARAHVTFVIVRQRGEQASELNQFNAHLAEGAKLDLFIVNEGAKLLRQEVNIDVGGRGGDFQLRGINLLDGRSHTDITMDVRHLDEASTSTEILRNVVMGRARGVFQGMIRVAQQAQKTDARMACNSLILSDEAEFDAKPELEIFADDVACGHGATVVDINHEHLFYLMARGIPEMQARSLLIKAFVNELAEEIENEELQQAIKNIIDGWLEVKR